jgi:S1-C subfamily serine protease
MATKRFQRGVFGLRAIVVLSVLALGWAAARIGADENIPLETLKEIKSATVFIKMEFVVQGVARRIPASGSGFVMLVTPKEAFIVTNHHVVTPPKKSPFKMQAGGLPTLVFFSGTRKEKVVTAKIVASDPSRDLAVLSVPAFEGMPKAIARDNKIELVETMGVFMFGFPFGQALSTNKGNPAITVGKGSVSSIRENERGEVQLVQIDGDLNPGNSGGPVVDSKGRLIGVAVAKIGNTRIGMAIPAQELSKMLLGRIGSISVVNIPRVPGEVDFKVQVQLIDPMHKLKEVSVLYRQANSETSALKAGQDGAWPALPGGTKVQLKLDGQSSAGSFRAKLTEKTGKVTFAVQASYVDGAGRTHYTQPAPYIVDLGKLIAGGSSPDKGPEVKVTGDNLAQQPRALGTISVNELKVNVKDMPACICWSADGKSFFLLESDGVVRRVKMGEFREELKMDAGSRCSWLSLSGEGLLLTVADRQEVWLLDPATFKVKKRFEVASAERAVSSPGLSVAFAMGRDSMTAIDLKTGTAKEYSPRDFPGGFGVGFAMPVVTPDGKYLFTMGGLEQLHRFKIDGLVLSHEEASQRIAQNGQGIAVSPDSKCVCLPSGGGNYNNLKNHPSVSPYSTYIYPTGNLNRPMFTINQGAYPRAVAFDAKNKKIYSQNHDHQFIIFNDSGRKLQEFKLAPRGDETRQIVSHPDGNRALVLTSNNLFFVEVGK